MIATRFVIGLMLTATFVGPIHAGLISPDKQRCVPLRAIRTETAETGSSLIVHTYDGRAFRNMLPTPCDGLLGLNELGTLGFEGKDGLLCAGDLIWLDHPGLLAVLGDHIDKTTCQLGSFEPISEMSLTESLRR